MEQISFKFGSFHGKPIGYSTATRFLIQVGNNRKGSYHTHDIVEGNLEKAIKSYESTCLVNNFKKRLVMENIVLGSASRY